MRVGGRLGGGGAGGLCRFGCVDLYYSVLGCTPYITECAGRFFCTHACVFLHMSAPTYVVMRTVYILRRIISLPGGTSTYYILLYFCISSRKTCRRHVAHGAHFSLLVRYIFFFPSAPDGSCLSITGWIIVVEAGGWWK